MSTRYDDDDATIYSISKAHYIAIAGCLFRGNLFGEGLFCKYQTLLLCMNSLSLFRISKFQFNIRKVKFGNVSEKFKKRRQRYIE